MCQNFQEPQATASRASSQLASPPLLSPATAKTRFNLPLSSQAHWSRPLEVPVTPGGLRDTGLRWVLGIFSESPRDSTKALHCGWALHPEEETGSLRRHARCGVMEAGDAPQGGGRGQGDTAYIRDPSSPSLGAERGAMNAEGQQSRIWSRTQGALFRSLRPCHRPECGDWGLGLQLALGQPPNSGFQGVAQSRHGESNSHRVGQAT